ncbi:MAG: hypothetical protein WD749_13985 [Phycisphaerales bacterium]
MPHPPQSPARTRCARRLAPLCALAAAGAAVWALSGCGDDAHAGLSGAPLRVSAILGEVGTSPGQFTYPRAIDADPSGLWVVDKSARVQRLDPDTGRATAYWRMPVFEHGKPTGITVGPPLPARAADAPYLLYVADTHYQRVMIYRPPPGIPGDPELVAKFGEYGDGPGQFIYLTDVALLTGKDGRTVERLYVGEYGGNDRISVFDASFKFLFAIGRPGDGSDGSSVEFNRPQSLAIDQERRQLVVTDGCNHRVGVFTLDGALIRWIGSPETCGDAPGSFAYPYGLALLGDGTALVSEFGNHRIQHVDYQTGETLNLYGVPGRDKGQFTSPWGVAVIGETVYALDSGNERIQAFPRPRAVRR